jgi:aminoglycoside phosphotransferase
MTVPADSGLPETPEATPAVPEAMAAAAGVEPVPAPVLALAAGERIRPVWVNEVGGRTFEVGAGERRRFVKWAPAGRGLDLAAEAARLAWAVAFTPVPRVLGQGRDAAGTWLVTSPLTGQMAAGQRWRAEPRTAVTAIGAGLRALHEALPSSRCPFSWSAAGRLGVARQRAARGLIDPAGWREGFQGLSLEDALRELAAVPPVDLLVVCHGDSCAPNTLIGDDGRWSGHVDLGDLGVADRWADLAVATWSTTWNYGPGWETALLDAYGVAPDPARTRYYRLLWELGP